MLSKKTIFILLAFILVLNLACAAPVLSATSTPRPKLVFPSATASILPSATPTASSTPTLVLPPVATATAAVVETSTPIVFPRIAFLRNTNCRVGPAVNYFLTTSFFKDRLAVAEGRNADSSWLWLRINGPEQHCWVSSSNVKSPESYAYLPDVDFPPLPEAPAQFFVE